MLSYRHHHHAGNPADVLKHIVLLAALRALTRKEKPLCYIDTHAGRGLYRLPAPGGHPPPEWPDGIGRLLEAEEAPEAVADWLTAVRALATDAASEGQDANVLHRYPGSPALAAHALRASDRLLLSELHPADAAVLLEAFEGDPRVEAAQRDGHAQIKRCLPPRERRALVLIDPAYERREEIDLVQASIDTSLTRMPTVTLIVWYPLSRQVGSERLLRASTGPDGSPLLRIELHTRPTDNPIGMNGSGLLVWNPPWQLDTVLKETLPWLARHLDQGGGGSRMEWLRPPS